MKEEKNSLVFINRNNNLIGVINISYILDYFSINHRIDEEMYKGSILIFTSIQDLLLEDEENLKEIFSLIKKESFDLLKYYTNSKVFGQYNYYNLLNNGHFSKEYLATGSDRGMLLFEKGKIYINYKYLKLLDDKNFGIDLSWDTKFFKDNIYINIKSLDIDIVSKLINNNQTFSVFRILYVNGVLSINEELENYIKKLH